MQAAVFDLIQERIQITNYRMPLKIETGNHTETVGNRRKVYILTV